MATLPTESSLTGATTTVAQQKTNFAALRNFIADLLGTDSTNKATARTTLGAGAVGDTLFTAATIAAVKSAIPIESGTAVASTSGTSIDFTSIPSWVKRITINFAGVSVNGTSNLLIQVGDSGGVEATGYLGSSAGGANAASPSVTAFTTGFGINASDAANVLHGAIALTLLDASANTWVASGNLTTSNTAGFVLTTGSKSLSATLDRVRITTVSGTPTFDAGTINILYE